MSSAKASTAATTIGLGPVGIWSAPVRFAAAGAGINAAVELERLGFAAIWVPGGVDSGVLQTIDALLTATSHIRVGTGILNIWKHDPAEVVTWWNGQAPQRRQRVILGLGVSHGPLIGESYQQPLAKMRTFLDGLQAAGMPLDHVCVAALGPKMLELAGQRTAGAHPYLVSVRHTAFARKTLGPQALLAPEQGVVLESSPARAREIAREFLRHYLRLPNYANNWLRDGFTQEDLDSLSDRLVDSLIAWGDIDAIAARIDEHLKAGADHVCLQVISASGMRAPLAEHVEPWQQLAKLLRAP
jgi:probable F420-dependent oxidoreductase